MRTRIFHVLARGNPRKPRDVCADEEQIARGSRASKSCAKRSDLRVGIVARSAETPKFGPIFMSGILRGGGCASVCRRGHATLVGRVMSGVRDMQDTSILRLSLLGQTAILARGAFGATIFVKTCAFLRF